MHPQVTSAAPGNCSICGMALEPIGQTAGAESTPVAEWRRLVICGGLGLVLLAVAMGGMLLGHGMGHDSAAHPPGQAGWGAALLGGQAGNWLQLLLATPIVFWGGWPILSGGWAGFRRGRPTMFSLISLGVLVAWTVSTVATIAPGIFPAAFRRADGSVELFFESAGMIVLLVLVGQLLETRARRGTTAGIRALMDLSPPTAELEATGATVPLAEVKRGDALRVRPGGRIPTDGIVLSGRSTCDEALLTGEPMPVARGPGDRVLGGAINGLGALVIEAEAPAHEALVARITRLVREAHEKRAPIEQLADRISAAFVPLVLLVAVVTFIGWALLGPQPRLTLGLLSAVSVLVIACPCALGLATPLAMTVAIGRGASAGILARSAEAIEKLSRVRTVVFDKTGTLTQGVPRVLSAVALTDSAVQAARTPAELANLSRLPAVSELLFQAASLEGSSEHPLARAFAHAAGAAGLEPRRPENLEAIVGRGVIGGVAGQTVLVGSEQFLRDRHVDLSPLFASNGAAAGEYEQTVESGATVVCVAVNDRLTGFFGVADPPRPEAAEVIARLCASGYAVEMLSGDSPAAARHVARLVGIDQASGGLSPQEKSQRIQRLRDDLRGTGSVIFVGDGINDAPALAAADVGVAMGSGADVALETADITLLSGGLSAVPRAIKLASSTMANVRQNLLLAFFYNLLALPVAAGLLLPLIGHVTSPMLAAAAMSLSSLSVIANALRLRRVDLDATTDSGLKRPAQVSLGTPGSGTANPS